ncbi:amino acid transporter [Streptomyces sp. NBC_01476]|uniref:nucleotidyltransferase domain-containing protein n=1 Tax=Streptomyces sp. NBC_01476 TaxID=2903881 RepID=UPI002E36D022|nr:amino acid transporter [Streptomyces sp. NBC_01476]
MTPTETPLGPWEPAPLAEVAALFAPLRVPWWIGGGYAIELAVGHTFRAHDDIDVVLLRRDQLAVQDVLRDWEWWAADPPGRLRPWHAGEILPFGVHDVWCRPGWDEPWRIQVMFDEAEGEEWVSRRSAALRRPIAQVGAVSPGGIPYLAPELQLFYKAAHPRPKDEHDFATVLPFLTPAQRRWLADALTRTYGPHPWTAPLRA